MSDWMINGRWYSAPDNVTTRDLEEREAHLADLEAQVAAMRECIARTRVRYLRQQAELAPPVPSSQSLPSRKVCAHDEATR